jgi:glucose-6-phosphate 1-dehydrogenase
MKTKLLIFGITGDLSTRKLLPALRSIIRTGQFDDLEVIGVSRREVDIEALLGSSLGSTELTSKLSIFSMDLASADDYVRLKSFVALENDEQLLIYLSVPPMAVTPIVDFLGEIGFTTPNIKLLFEKPFGMDYISAQDVIARTARHFHENQTYRIDHYLAKEMAQNIVAFRGGNAIFSHLWNNRAIEKIEIVALEKIGIEGRTGFYEQTGALRDVLQGHLMQLLALTLMDIPHDLNWEKLPELRLKALQSILLADPSKATRAQYEGYGLEAKNIDSLTETFVSVELASTAPQWQGVPIVLTTGKALASKTTEVRIRFRKRHDAQSNYLILHIQPDEGVEIELSAKKPGYDRQFQTQKLAFRYPEDTILPDAYEQVLVDAIRSRKSLFTSSDEVLTSWRILQPLLDRWEMSDDSLKTYPVGSPTHSICSVS